MWSHMCMCVFKYILIMWLFYLFRVTSFLSGVLVNYLWYLVICMWISLFWYRMSSLREEIMACSLLLALTRRGEALKHRLWENKYCESFWPVMSVVLGETQKTEKNGPTCFFSVEIQQHTIAASERPFEALYFQAAVFESCFRAHIWSRSFFQVFPNQIINISKWSF